MKIKNTEWLGNILVDSGEIMIVDPCYELRNREYVHKISGFGGDGLFPVFAIHGNKKYPHLITEIRIDFSRKGYEPPRNKR